MLYKRYFERTQRLAAFFTRLYRLRALIITVLSVIALTSVTLAAAKGLILSEQLRASHIPYGEEMPYSARAFLGEVRYEYRADTDTVWTEEAPTQVGTYRVRAVGRSFFGNPRYSDEYAFTITARPLVVSVAEQEVVYGNTPALTADVCYGHTVVGEVTYEGLSDSTTPQVTPILDSIRILDADGRDMSANYTVTDTAASVVTILPREILVTVEDRGKIFDGLELTFDGYRLTEGTLAEGDRLIATVDDAIVNVGTVANTPILKVYNADGDITRHYNIRMIEGTLTVEARPLLVTTADGEAVYDGTPYTRCDDDDYRISEDTPPVDGHTVLIHRQESASILDVGEQENYLALSVVNRDGVDETANYSLIFTLGTLKVTPRPVTIVTTDASFEYDGTAHSATELADGYAVAGDELYVETYTTVRDVADSGCPNELTVRFRRDGRDISGNYAIEYRPGTLTVTPRPVSLVSADLSVVYDAEPHSAADMHPTYAGAYTGNVPPAALAEGDTVCAHPDAMTFVLDVTAEAGVANVCTPLFTRASATDGTVEDITDNYTVTSITYGILMVTPRPITVLSEDMAFVYDGAVHRYPQYRACYTAEADTAAATASPLPAVVGNDRLTVAVVGTCQSVLRDPTNPDTYLSVANTMDVSLTTLVRVDESGMMQDVSANYTITYIEGALTVLPRPITVEADSGVWLYDGTAKTAENYTVTWSDTPDGALWALATLPDAATPCLLEGDMLTAVMDGAYTAAGAYTVGVGSEPYENRVASVQIHAADGHDVTANYRITRVSGTITILPRPITITADSGVWLYDGTEKSTADYTVTWSETPLESCWTGVELRGEDTPIVASQQELVVLSGRATDVKGYADGLYTAYPNEVATVSVLAQVNGVTEDVTENYLITRVAGELTILPRPITVTSATASWIYDGTEKSATEPSVCWTDGTWSTGQWSSVTPPDGKEACILPTQYADIAVTGACTYVRRDTDRRVLAYPNTIDTEASTIRTADGSDVGHNYRITYAEGSLTIEPRPITVETESRSWVYDDMPTDLSLVRLHATSPYAIPSGHKLEAVDAPTFTDVGSYTNVHTVRLLVFGASGAYVDVTDSFDVSYRYGQATIRRRPVTIHVSSAAKIYDDTPLLCPDFTYTVASDDGKSSDGLLSHLGHVCTDVEIVGSQTDAGTGTNRYVAARICRADGTDVTENYLITAVNGTLEVKPRPITIITEDMTWLYDGAYHKHEAFSTVNTDIPWDDPAWSYVSRPADRGEPILAGHTASMVFLSQCRDVVGGNLTEGYDSVPNAVASDRTVILAADGRNVTANYRIEYIEGSLTVLPRPVTVTSGSQSWIYDGLTHSRSDYELAWAQKPAGEQWSLVELPTELSVLADDDSVYVAVIGSCLDVMGGNAEDGYASCPNAIDRSATAFTSTRRGDVTRNYVVVEYIEGELTILPRPITVTSASMSWMYDATTHTQPILHSIELSSTLPAGDQWANVTLPTANPLVVGDAMKVCFTGECTYVLKEKGSIQSVPNTFLPFGSDANGSIIRDADGRCVSQNYYVTAVYGELTVTPRPLTIQCGGGEAIYDGMSHTFAGFECTTADGSLPLPTATAHTPEANGVPAFREAGVYENRFAVKVYTTVGTERLDVTDSFDITYLSGTVIIKPRPIALKLEGVKMYNGFPQTADILPLVGFDDGNSIALSPVDGHFFTADMAGVLTEPGEVPVQYVEGSLRIYDGNDNDVTANYEVLYMECGTLTVTRRPISVQTANAKKAYDGTPLTAPTTELCEDSLKLVLRHYIVLDITGTQTEVGHSPNTFDSDTLRILDADGTDVTHCYEITLTEGTLEVTASDGGGEGEGEDVSGGGDSGGGNFKPTGSSDYIVSTPQDTETQVGYLFSEYSGTFYLRMCSAGDYLGSVYRWGNATPYSGAMADGYSFSYLPSLYANDDDTSAAMKFRDMQACLMPYYLSIGNASTLTQGSDVGATMQNGNAYTVTYAQPTSTLSWLNRLRRLTEDERRALLGDDYEAELAYREFVYGQYLQIGNDTLAYMQSVIEEQGFNPDDPGLVAKVAYFIQHSASYNLDYDRALDKSEDMAVAFLRDYKEGVCRHYATSATMLFRALGIPARYTVGYLVPAMANEWTEIISGGARNQCHAWVEIYIDGLGWMMVEVTGSDDSSDSPSGDTEDSDSQTKQVLSLTPVYMSKTYDGLPLVHSHKLISNDGLLEELLDSGYTYTAEVFGSITEIGRVASTISRFTLYDPLGNDVTDQYTVEYNPSVMEVLGSDIVLDVYVYQNIKEYDGTPLTYRENAYYVFDLPDGMELDMQLCISMTNVDTLTLNELNANRSAYIRYTVTQNGLDMTDQVTIRFVNIFREYVPGDVVAEVKPRLLELTAESKTAAYTEGAVLRADGWSVSKNPVVEGHSIDEQAVVVLGQCSDPDTVGINTIKADSVFIYDQNGRDVTANYDIRLVDGSLQFAVDD